MAAFTLDETIRATNAAVENPAPVRFTGVVTDTRRIVPGALFVALRGRSEEHTSELQSR